VQPEVCSHSSGEGGVIAGAFARQATVLEPSRASPALSFSSRAAASGRVVLDGAEGQRPEAFVYAILIASVALVFAVLVRSMFNGGQARDREWDEPARGRPAD
jgi:hypothetical protein